MLVKRDDLLQLDKETLVEIILVDQTSRKPRISA